MSFVPLLVLAMIAFALYAIFFKLAAFIFKRKQLNWGDSFLFSVLLLVILFGVKAISSLASSSASEWMVSFLSMIAGLLLGGWFFSTRAKSREGQELGWAGGFVLTLIGFALLLGTGLALVFVVQLVGKA